MKTILIMLASLTLSLGVSAQRKVSSVDRDGGHEHEESHEYTRVYVSPYSLGLGYGFYGPGYGYGYPFYGNPYYGSPYRYRYGFLNQHYRSGEMPYKLTLQIQSIKIDYKDKIRKARNDKSMSHSQRRHEIQSLKTERAQSIINAKKDFVGSVNMNDQNRQQNGHNTDKNPNSSTNNS